MRCEDALSFIEEYVDGELDERSARALTAHMASCESCHQAYEELKREQEIYSRYHRDIDTGVSQALWAGVYSRIQAEKVAKSNGPVSRFYQRLALVFSGPRLSPAWAVMMVVLAVALTVLTMEYLRREDRRPAQQLAGGSSNQVQPVPSPVTQPSQVPAPGVSPGTVAQTQEAPIGPERAHKPETVRAVKPMAEKAPSKASPEEVVREAEEKQLAAIAMLSREIDRRRSDLDPGVVAKFQVALTAIDRTIAETRQAVHQHPGDPVAAQYMLAAYAEKIEVLKEIADQ
ncbi:MAG TPA: zf-HC2 domain-containing protein [Blastocatellia bacterium]